MTPPVSLRAYLAASRAAAPLARLLLRRRLARGREDPARLEERMGGPGAGARPEGALVWTHAASIGEALAALTLIRAMQAERPGLRHLLTTGTVTSARMAAERLPEGALHRYAPLDAAAFLTRFLDYWRPDLSIRIDSEIWPAAIWLTAERGVPMALVNARLSEKSARKWRRFAPKLIGALMRRFALVLAQDEDSAARFAALGALQARAGAALKSSAPPPEAEEAALSALRAEIGARPVLLAASTHPGEEEMVAAAHRLITRDAPDLLTIIAPRHPERGARIVAALRADGVSATLRSAGEGPSGAEVYVADTLGEMGLWLRLARLAFIGGSLAGQGLGGHTPYEAAALGAPVAHGPETENFADAYETLRDAGAALRTPDAATLAAAAAQAFGPEGAEMGEAAARALAVDPSIAERAARDVLALLPESA